jgi:hypothetical protein
MTLRVSTLTRQVDSLSNSLIYGAWHYQPTGHISIIRRHNGLAKEMAVRHLESVSLDPPPRAVDYKSKPHVQEQNGHKTSTQVANLVVLFKFPPTTAVSCPATLRQPCQEPEQESRIN